MDIHRTLFLMQQTYATLFSLANKLQVEGDRCLDRLTSRQYMTMIAIAHLQEEERTLNNIASKLGTTKQSVKQMINIMESKGYIIIESSHKDKRAINIIITEVGKQVLLDVSERGIYFMEELFKDFSIEEMEILWSLLKKLFPFDGEKQDGFEGEGTMDMGEDYNETQKRVFKEFERRRNNRKRGARL